MSATGKANHEDGRGTAGRRLWAALTLALLVGLAGCAAPQTGAGGSARAVAPTAGNNAAAPATAATPPRKRAPPMSDPLPAQRVADAVPAPAGKAPKLDRSCKTSADCVVKDIGNCCGYYPRCVNANAAVDPKAVQAQCARSGMASVCGFKPVEGCECVKGECQDKLMLFEGQ